MKILKVIVVVIVIFLVGVYLDAAWQRSDNADMIQRIIQLKDRGLVDCDQVLRHEDPLFRYNGKWIVCDGGDPNKLNLDTRDRHAEILVPRIVD